MKSEIRKSFYSRALIPTPKEMKRFWSKVNKSGPVHPYDPGKGSCWEWTWSKNSDGYGQFAFKRTTLRAHRFAFVACVAAAPASVLVMHSCNNPGCVNPGHLSIGTAQENKDYCIATGRARAATGDQNGARTRPERLCRGSAHHFFGQSYGVRGEDVWTARLKESQVREIRALFAQGQSRKGLAERFKVSLASITGIVGNRSWRHVA